ncbi:MAG TPA: neutral zinc metallopeptidase [Nocardioides sp.]|nr:neutral zinc metallopeptidase [Nocardioides sp.]
MRFNPKARLDRSRVSDSGRRGGGAGGTGMRLPIPGGAKAGGGIGGLVLVIIVIVIFQLVGGGGDGSGGVPSSGGSLDTSRVDAGGTERYANCQTGEDANQDEDCARVAVENSLTDFWADTLESQSGVSFSPEKGLATFSGAINTGCGQASSQVGPFYCPADRNIYLDTTFFEDVLQGQLGGPAGDFVEPYVLAHEYGHHIQNLTGAMGKVRTQQGPESDSVRLELQADCYAGMWARAATSTEDASGVPLITDITQQDMAEALEAAKSVGDDRIQQQSGGRVDPESWTHGSAEERQRWFQTGYQQGSMDACDTFSASQL